MYGQELIEQQIRNDRLPRRPPSNWHQQNDWVNANTGEVASGFMITKASRYPRGMTFTTFFDEGLAYIGRLSLTPTQRRILDFLISKMDFGNFCQMTQAVIARELGLSPQAVSAAFKRLSKTELVVLQKDPKTATETLRVSASVAWRGRSKDWTADMTKPLLSQAQLDAHAHAPSARVTRPALGAPAQASSRAE